MSEVLRWPGWTDLTVLGCWVGLIGCVIFAVRYHALSGGAWRKTPEGQWMMYGRLIIAALLVLILINRVFPGWPGRRVVTFALTALFAAQTFWPLRLVNRAHRSHPHAHEGTHRK